MEILKMKMVIIGSGNVAYHLARAFSESGTLVKQIFGRNRSALEEITDATGIPHSTQNLADADFYLLCVSDGAVAETSKLISKKNCLVAHTAGSLPKEVLQGDYRKACFYPLQTFSKAKSLDYKKIPFFIDAENAVDEEFLKNIAGKISTEISVADFQKRRYAHLTAVFTCNFVNLLFAKGKEIADSQEIPFRYFYPLIDETVAKMKNGDPRRVQTGPAARRDFGTIEMQKELLKDAELQKIYSTLTDAILKMKDKP